MSNLLQRRKDLYQQVEDIEGLVLKMNEQLTQLQPLANLGMTWAMTAHELNNLLMPIINYSQLALKNPKDYALCEKALSKALLLSEKAADIIDKVMMLANPTPQEKQRYSFGYLVQEVFLCIGRDFQKDRIAVIHKYTEDISIWADGTAIQQVLMNLILNARQAMLENGGQLFIAAQEEADGTLIEIADTGSGIEPEKLPHIFTPFFTDGKEDGKGLGLAFCRKVIEAHEGYITVDSKPGQGTSFKIMLPKYYQ